VASSHLVRNPDFHALHKKLVGNGKTRKNEKGLAGGGAGRRDSGVRRVVGYLGAYEYVGRIEKPGDDWAFVFRK